MRIQLGDLVQKTLRRKEPLPRVEEVKRRLGTGADPARDAPTVDEWPAEWIAAKKTELAPGTLRSYQAHIANYLVPPLGGIRLDRLRPSHIQAMFDAIAEHNDHIDQARASSGERVRSAVRGLRTVGPATQHRIRATLRSALNAALRRPDLPLSLNPAVHVHLPNAPRTRPLVWTPERVAQWKKTGRVPCQVMVWTPEQTRAFLRRARGHRLHALFHLIALKGLRRGEAVGLPWTETRLGEGTIDIRTQIVQLGWETITTAPKSLAGQRTVTLDEGTAKVLRAWRRRQAAERLKAGVGWQDSGLVFTDEQGRALHPAWVTDQFHRIASWEGLPSIGLHGLRHGAASMMLAAGVDVKVVSVELGHASAHFTQDTYQHVYPDVARAAAATAALLDHAE